MAFPNLFSRLGFAAVVTASVVQGIAAEYQYGFVDNKLVITKYLGAGGDIVIPATVAGEPIWGIGMEAFVWNTNVTSVTISKGITSIASSAFFGCEKLTQVNIPEGLSEIIEYSFAGCQKLTAINVAAANASFQSIDGILFDKSGETLLQCPAGKVGSYAIPSTVKTIGPFAFAYCMGLSEVAIPEGLVSIKYGAFLNAILPDLSIPSTVTTIDPGSVAGVWQSITVHPNNPSYRSIDGALLSKDGTILLRVPVERPGVYTIPSGVVTIEAEALMFCFNLTKIVVPEGVKTIRFRALSYCQELMSVTLPKSLETLESVAFEECTNLRSIVFLGNQPSISDFAFVRLNARIYYTEGGTGWSSLVAGLPASLWNARVETTDGSFVAQDGVVAFTVKGTDGIDVSIEASDDLKNWTEVALKTLTNGSARYVELDASTRANRVFRLRTP